MEARRLFDGFEQGLDRVCSMVVQWLFNDCSMVVQWLSPFVVVVGVGGGHECGCGFCFISHEFWQVGCDCSFGDSFEPANSTFVAFRSDFRTRFSQHGELRP